MILSACIAVCSSEMFFAFRKLEDDKEVFDVNLACDDEHIQAHKVILGLQSIPHHKGVKLTDPKVFLTSSRRDQELDIRVKEPIWRSSKYKQ